MPEPSPTTPLPVAEAEGGMGEETQGASFGPGSCPTGPTASRSSGFAASIPSRTLRDAFNAGFWAWAGPANAAETMRWAADEETAWQEWAAQETEAEGRNTEGGSVHEGSVAEGHAPDNLLSRLTAAEAARDEALKERDEWQDQADNWQATAAAEAEIGNERRAEAIAALSRAERAEKALAFYADEQNYRMNGPLDPNSSWFEGYDRARAALVQPAPTEDGKP